MAANMTPKISVILPVYNAGLYLKAAIESILTQTFKNFEFIVINDGSSDASEKIILDFIDPRIRYIRNEKNLGLIATLNKGIGLSQGEYIARMDQDDISYPTRFEEQVAFLESHKEAAVIATKLVLINEEGYQTGHWTEDFDITTPDEIEKTLPVINCIGHPTVMMRASLIREVNGYNPKFKNSEDWGLWLKLISKGFTIAKLDKVLLEYRIHQTSATVTANKNSVPKKIIGFKYAYLLSQVSSFSFKSKDFKVVSTLLKDILKYVFKPLLSPFIYLLKLPWLGLIKQYFEVKKQLSLVQSTCLIYIFPYYHTGGAEKVHAAIAEAVEDKTSVTFITRHSEDDVFLGKFKQYSNVIEVDQLLLAGFTKRWLIKKIVGLLKQQLTVMSSNAEFFYELIPHLPANVKCIDLIHAFVHLNEMGPERWSLPVISRLNTRVVINEKTKKDFDYFYKAHGINPDFNARIQYISNFADKKLLSNRNFNETLKVLYAGRGASEKRLPIIAAVAKICKNKKLPFEFYFAGNVKDFIPKKYLDACILLGNISDEAKMDALYASSHLLIVASSREGFPMVIMEAMMRGVVPISTAVGGIPEHVHPNQNGILVDEIDEFKIIESFVKNLEILSQNRNDIQLLSNNAQAYASVHFDHQTFINAYISLLKP